MVHLFKYNRGCKGALPLKNLSMKIIYILYFLSASFLILEIIFRILPTAEVFDRPLINEKNSVINYYPNQKITWSLGPDFYQIARKTTNNYGYVSSFNYKKSARPDLMVIGDSFVEALQVENEYSLQEKLKTKNPNLNVYSIGISGAALSQYVQFIRFSEDEFNPQSYAIVIINNDFDQSLCAVRQLPGHYCFDQNLDLRLVPFEGYSLLKGLARKSAFIRYAIINARIIDLIKPSKRIENKIASEETLKKSFLLIDKFFSEIKSLVNEKKVYFILDFNHDLLHTPPKDLENNYTEKVLSYFKQKSKEFHLIDMQPIFLSHGNGDLRKFIFKNDGHWNETGHDLASYELFQAMKRHQ